MIIKVQADKELLGIIVRAGYKAEGINFLTENDSSMQLAFMSHPKGKGIAPHVHNGVERVIKSTMEVIYLKKGKLRVDFYNSGQKYLESYILCAGDLIFLPAGGHGFEVLEEIEMFEVKQGPYAGEADKTRFEAIDRKNLNIKN